MRKQLLLITILFLFNACTGNKEPKKEEMKSEILKPIEPVHVILETYPTQRPPTFNTKSIEGISLEERLNLYFMQLKTLNSDQIISMTYPKFFRVINRDIFRNFLNTMITSNDLSISSFKIKIIDIGPINSYSNGQFAQIDYLSDITIQFINPELYSDKKKFYFLADVMSKKYGYDNIRIDTEQRTISIKKEERLLAIEENGLWTFVGDNDEYRRLYPKFLPFEILNSI